MRNQRGEISTGVMMAVMMIFGGTQLLHGEYRFEGDHALVERKHTRDEGMGYVHDDVEKRTAVPAQVKGR